MNIVTQVDDWKKIRETLSGNIGFVPTMGNLHAGHLALVARAKAENDLVVVSIFVNPTQFNRAEDLAAYPRTLQQDYEKLAAVGVDHIFVPEYAALYPDAFQVRVTETVLSEVLEGAHRPGHFEGMLTVVMKLLNLMQASNAYFGEKDFQQLLLVKKMASALFMPVNIIACETVRAEDGLALSSRNSRLSEVERHKATLFSTLLSSGTDVDDVIATLSSHGFKIDYIVEQWQRRLGAVWLGDVRLIDNVAL